MTTQELQALAAQLKTPNGDMGLEVADMMHETNINMTLQTIRQLNLQAGEKLLELGHGNAAHLEQILDQNKDLNYCGLEISELMHAEAKKKNSRFVSGKRASFTLYDGVSVPFPDNSFDKIFTVNTIYFWNDPEKLLAELYRVVKKDGVLCITFAPESFMKHLPFTPFGFNLYSPEKVEKLAETTAFSIAHSETHTETVKTKAGDPVEREFITLLLKK